MQLRSGVAWQKIFNVSRDTCQMCAADALRANGQACRAGRTSRRFASRPATIRYAAITALPRTRRKNAARGCVVWASTAAPIGRHQWKEDAMPTNRVLSVFAVVAMLAMTACTGNRSLDSTLTGAGIGAGGGAIIGGVTGGSALGGAVIGGAAGAAGGYLYDQNRRGRLNW
jgi:hypothetical protein